MQTSATWRLERTSAMIPTSNPAMSMPFSDPDASDIKHAAAGDSNAFARLLDRHLERLHRLAWRSLGNEADAQDVVQDAFLRAYLQLPRWRHGQARFSTWLYRVTFNLCQDRLRSRRESLPVETLALADAGHTPDTAFEQQDRQRRLGQAIANLPQRQREALLLCHYEGLSNTEAAAVLKISTAAIESLLARARRNLRILLPKDLASPALELEP